MRIQSAADMTITTEFLLLPMDLAVMLLEKKLLLSLLKRFFQIGMFLKKMLRHS